MSSRTITINRKKYKVIEESLWGDISFDTKTIRIAAGLKPTKKAEIILHEGLHAAFPDASEEKITRIARDLTRFLRIMDLLKQ